MLVNHITSRGDLLRCLKQCKADDEKQLLASILGYERGMRKVEPSKIHYPQDELSQNLLRKKQHKQERKESEQLSAKRPLECFHVVTHRVTFQKLEEKEEKFPEKLRGVKSLSKEDLRPFDSSVKPLEHIPIIPPQRLKPFLKKTLSYQAGKKLDIPKLIKQSAHLKFFKKIPVKPQQLPAGRVYVLLDLNKRLLPFWEEAHHIAETIIRTHGKNGLEIRVIDNVPQASYYDWFGKYPFPQAWKKLQSHSVVFIISDMGQLLTKDQGIQKSWTHFLEQLRKQRICPTVLSPVSNYHQNLHHSSLSNQVLWSRCHPLKPHKIKSKSGQDQKYIERVLGLLSVAVHVEPELLRAIMHCLPAQESDSGVEAAVMLHADIVWGYTAITLKTDRREHYQSIFQLELASLQRQVMLLIKQHHSSQFPSVWSEEVINAKPLVNFPIDDIANLAHAENFMKQFVHGYIEEQTHSGMQKFARRHLARQSTKNISEYKEDYTSAMYAQAYKEELQNGAAIPNELDSQIVQSLIRTRKVLKRYRVLQIGESLMIAPYEKRSSPESQLVGGISLAEFETHYDTISIIKITEIVAKTDLSQARKHLVVLGNTLQTITTKSNETLVLDTGLEHIKISAIQKPCWAHAMTHNGTGIKAYLYALGKNHRFSVEIAVTKTVELKRALNWETPSDQVGFDQYGLYLDLNLENITQRFRYIEPGTFLMGSPEDEPEREPWSGSKETQHQVTLTKGYWMADTAVTQAFYQAVTGKNPSKFTEDLNNPVETVSWEDTEAFIKKLNQLFPALDATLPTEAQWEYACRAGTSTPFSFGENISPEQVNYNGEHPYNKGKKGLNRKKTIAVKSLPPNSWGLYEMHGNVWEWCADTFKKDLGKDAIEDPHEKGKAVAERVIRGGSWYDDGRRVRSAFRGRLTPDGRHDDLGFRLLLGHVSSGQDLPAQSGNRSK